MAAPGDSLLLRAGLIRPEQLAEAQRLRARSGGTVGEWLIRLGVLTEPQLVDFYHRRLLVPRVGAAQLLRVPSDVLAAVPADMASEFRVFPVTFDANKVLTLAMADPSDIHVAEEVAFYSGRACNRAVAGVSEILGAIDRHYRARPAYTPRPGAIKPTMRGQTPIATPEPAAPAAAPPRTSPLATVRPSPASAPAAVAASPPRGPVTDEDPVLLTRVKVPSPAPVVPSSPAPPQESVPTPIAPEPSASRRTRFVTQTRSTLSLRDFTPPPIEVPVVTPSPSAADSPPAPTRKRSRTLPGLTIAAELPIEALRASQSREDIAAAMLGYAARFAPAAALLVVRRSTLAGHDARGAVDPEEVRALQIPLEEPSLVRDVVQSRLPYRGAIPATAPLGALRALTSAHEGDALLVPISVNDRVIGVLLAAGVILPPPDVALHDLAREAGAAYERIIRSGRR